MRLADYMPKYDLTDIGLMYRGVSSVSSYKTQLDNWEIIDIPEDVPEDKAKLFVSNFLSKICAIEIPTSLTCNLRCRYCYIDDPRMKNKKVSTDNVERILEESSEMFDGLSKNKEIRLKTNKNGIVYLSPWGAEPFANVATLELMRDWALKNYGKNYKLSTSTNGTIWNDRIKKLICNLIDDNAFSSIQVSLDGPSDLQNHQRPFLGGNPSFGKVKEFVTQIEKISDKKQLKKKLYSFCSTIHLVDDNFVENWISAADFFSIPNQWHTSLPVLPMRMSGEDMLSKEYVDRFVDAQKEMVKLVKFKVKNGINVVDFYTSKLFSNTANRSRNAFPYCSALNTQIGIDMDGSIYPCHGPITTPMYKPFLWYGNVFDKQISYKQLYRNFSYQYGTMWTKSKCSHCPIYNYTSGNICWSCPAHNLSITGEPSIDSVLKCIAYNESFKYWIQIAKMTIDNPILKDIPAGWFNDMDENLPQHEHLLSAMSPGSHFDMNYDGLLTNSINKFTYKLKENIPLSDKWWDFDDFKEISLKEGK